MSVSELLEKQDEGFVSLYDLLHQIAAVGSGSSIEDAAAYLSRVLQRRDAPPWYTRSRAVGVQPFVTRRGGLHRGHSLLTHTANYGWERSDDVPF
jgi:hypothetical protein